MTTRSADAHPRSHARPGLLGEGVAIGRNVEDRSPDRIADHLDPDASREPLPRIFERDGDGLRRASEQPVRQTGNGVRLVQNDRDVRPSGREHRRHAHVPTHSHRDIGAAHEWGAGEE